MPDVIPESNLAPESQRWRRWVEAQIMAHGESADSLTKRASFTLGQVNIATQTATQAFAATQPDAVTAPKEPEQVVDVVLTPEAYWDSDGAARGRVNATWTPVFSDQDGAPLTVSRYEIWGRPQYTAPPLPDADPDNPDAPIVQAVEPEFLRLTTTEKAYGSVFPLEMDTAYTLIIRAISVDEVVGPFSDELDVVASGTLPVMAAPTVPTVTSKLGVILVSWDGLMADGAPPAQFSGVYAEISDTVDGPFVTAGQNLLVDGDSAIGGKTIGQTYYVHLVGIDRANQTTTPSAAVQVTVTGVDLGDLDAAVNDAISGAQTAADEGKAAAQAAQTAADGADMKAAQALSDASNALTAASDAQTAATNAQTAAQQASDDAETASGLVASKGRTWIQSTQPAGSATDLWIDTTGGANTPKKWDTATSKWVAVTDKAATDAAQKAVDAQTAATNAATAAAAADTKAVNAQTKADQAFTNAGAADTKASTALTTANGKNRVIFSTSDASGTSYTAGDLWFKKSGSLIIAQWEFTTSWQSRTLDSAVIANLDAGKITAGLIDADRIGANSVTADKIAVGDFTNFVPDPKFTLGQMNLPGTRYPSTDPAVPAGAPNGYVLSLPGTYDMFATATIGGGFPVNGGDRFYVEAMVYHAGTSTNNLSLRVWTSSANRTTGTGEAWGYPGVSVTTASAQGKWVRASGIVTIADTATQNGVTKPQQFGWAALGTGGSAGTGWWIADWNIRRMTGSTLIEDGAITTSKIVTGSITAASGILADAVIVNAKIANGAVDNAKIANLDATKINAGTINVDRLNGGDVRAKIIAAGKITANDADIGSLTASIVTSDSVSGVTITGTTVQTTSTANRGVKLTSSGIYGYNASGTQTFKVDAATGNTTINALTATNAVISGNITATSGSFTGQVNASSGTITGDLNVTSGSIVTFDSGSSKKRVALSSGALRFYPDGTTLNPTGVIWAEKSDGLTNGADDCIYIRSGTNAVDDPLVVGSTPTTSWGSVTDRASMSIGSADIRTLYTKTINGVSQVDTDWVNMTFKPDYQTQGGTAPAFRKIGNTVYTRGLVDKISGQFAANVTYEIGTVPTTFCSSEWIYLPTGGDIAAAQLQILDTGLIRVRSFGATNWISVAAPPYLLG